MEIKRNLKTKIYIPNLTQKQIYSLEDYLNSHLDTCEKLGIYNKVRISKNKNKINKNFWEISFSPNNSFDYNLFCGYISGFFNVLYKSQ